jgi:hypothetical protein
VTCRGNRSGLPRQVRQPVGNTDTLLPDGASDTGEADRAALRAEFLCSEAPKPEIID